MGTIKERARDGAWLPNVVAGVSVWSLARDLNAPELFDGRLLEPDVDGPETLPDAVEWDLTGLVPLAEARARFGVELELATDAFMVCVERAERWLATDGRRFEGAFTLPGLTLDGGAHYFFRPADGRLYVKSWGAAPHRAAAKEVHVFGPAALLAQPRTGPLKPTRRRGLAIALIASGLLALVAAVIFVALGSGTESPETPPPASTETISPRRTQPPPTETTPPPLPEPTQVIHFEVDLSSLGPSEYAALAQARAFLAAHPVVGRLRVEGHTDGRGEATHNAQLGAARARAVRDWLIARGVDPARLEAGACADRFPLAADRTEDGRRQNRRVELYVVEPAVARAPHSGCEVFTSDGATERAARSHPAAE